jgi:hypothetical protein
LRHQVYVHFIDMLGRPSRPVDHCFLFLTELLESPSLVLDN